MMTSWHGHAFLHHWPYCRWPADFPYKKDQCYGLLCSFMPVEIYNRTNSWVVLFSDALTLMWQYYNMLLRCDSRQIINTLWIIYDLKYPGVAHNDYWSWSWSIHATITVVMFSIFVELRWAFTFNYISITFRFHKKHHMQVKSRYFALQSYSTTCPVWITELF